MRSGTLPKWLKRNIPKGNAGYLTERLVDEFALNTVCAHAKCPNRMECYARRTVTFLILGDVCTRACRFCGVAKGKPGPPDADEPARVAAAAKKLGLRHVVVTCVTRDDLPDGGAETFARVIRAIREETGATVEVLPSDFAGNADALDRVIDALPDVYNYNTETVPRLYAPVRGPRLDYSWTLETFRRIRQREPNIPTKTGLMLGLGETMEEVVQVAAELHDAGCRMITVGQYLRPSADQMEVVRYVPPEEFDQLGELLRSIGYEQVAAGPFVRSSYRAGEMLQNLRGEISHAS